MVSRMLLTGLLTASCLSACASAVEPGLAVVTPMAPERWRSAPPVEWAQTGTAAPPRFARYQGMPDGTMTVADEGIAVSDATFSQGTIEFDIKPLDYGDAGIIFHRDGETDGEFFYLRGNPDCPAANDCIQYAPITHRQMQWDLYPNRQAPAQIAPAGWNHVRLVVAGRMMAVWLNRETTPSLVAPLQGSRDGDGIAFKGPAVYANLVVRPGLTGIPDVPEAAPGAPVEPGAVTAWTVAPPAVLPAGKPLAASIPGAAAWRPIAAEPSGLVNLSRAFDGLAAGAPSVGWLKTVMTATQATKRTVRIGWARQVSVFLNGVLVFSGDNPYEPAARRLSPDGRIEPDNAAVPLDLRAGRNEIVLAVGNGWVTADGQMEASPYGWGAEMHVADGSGF